VLSHITSVACQYSSRDRHTETVWREKRLFIFQSLSVYALLCGSKSCSTGTEEVGITRDSVIESFYCDAFHCDSLLLGCDSLSIAVFSNTVRFYVTLLVNCTILIQLALPVNAVKPK